MLCPCHGTETLEDYWTHCNELCQARGREWNKREINRIDGGVKEGGDRERRRKVTEEGGSGEINETVI